MTAVTMAIIRPHKVMVLGLGMFPVYLQSRHKRRHHQKAPLWLRPRFPPCDKDLHIQVTIIRTTNKPVRLGYNLPPICDGPKIVLPHPERCLRYNITQASLTESTLRLRREHHISDPDVSLGFDPTTGTLVQRYGDAGTLALSRSLTLRRGYSDCRFH